MLNEPIFEGGQSQQPEHMDTNIRYRQLLDSFPISKKIESVLDVGCGLGVSARTLIEKFRCEYYGVDDWELKISEAIKIRDGNVDASIRGQIQFIQGDATKLDQITSLPSKFDMVVSRHPQIRNDMKNTFEQIFESAYGKLANEGVFLVTTLTEREYRNARKAFNRLGIEIQKSYSGENRYSNGIEDKFVLLGIKRQ